MRTLSVLNSTGDTRITWDPSDPVQCASVRKEVADLKAAGFVFFLADGSPADEVTAGGGTLLVRRLDAEEVVAEDKTIKPDPEPEPFDATIKRRGRPRKNVPAPDQNVVAVRPLRGG